MHWVEGDTLVSAAAHGGMVEVHTPRALLLFHDGVNLRLYPAAGPIPAKHQLLLTFEDGSALSASVQMYGGLYAWDRREMVDTPLLPRCVGKALSAGAGTVCAGLLYAAAGQP